MTFIWAILTITFLVGVWIAADSLRGDAGPRLLRPRGESRRGAPLSYRPVLRLLGTEDLSFLSQHADLKSQLRESRRVAMRLYLRDLRKDFLEVWGVCRVLAPISAEPGYLSQLSRQYWSFHWMYAAALAHCLLPFVIPGRAGSGRLVSAVADLRAQARSLLAVSDSALAVPAAA